MNQIFRNHSALQSELFSHLCELTYETGTWNNLFQYLLLNMFWPGSIKAFRSLSCAEVPEQRQKSVLFLVTIRNCSSLLFALGTFQAETPQPGICEAGSWRSVCVGHCTLFSVRGAELVERIGPWDTMGLNYPSIKYTHLLWDGNGTEMYSFLTV